MKAAFQILLGALASTGFALGYTLAGSQSEGPRGGTDQAKPSGQETTKLELELEAPQVLTFRVERRDANPLRAGADQPGQREGQDADEREAAPPGRDGASAMLEHAKELRYTLRPQRASQQGQTLVQVEVAQGGMHHFGDRPSAPAGGGLQDDEVGQTPDRPVASNPQGASQAIASFQIVLDADGRIVRMEKAQPGAANESGRKDATALGADEKRWRSDLALILGTGLHARPLQPGQVYQVGDASSMSKAPVEASAPKSGAEAGAFALRFERVQSASSAPVGRPQEGESDPSAGTAKTATKGEASFSVVAMDAAGAAGAGLDQPGRTTGAEGDEEARDAREGEQIGGIRGSSIGRASYSLADGLVLRFDVRPGPDAKRTGEAQVAAQSILIERVSAN